MNQDEIAELKRQFFEQASWGFVSRYGRTGRILSVRTDDRTLEIATPKLKPRWDVHMVGGGDRHEGYAGSPLLLIAGWSGSAA